MIRFNCNKSKLENGFSNRQIYCDETVVPRLIKLMNNYGYQFILETFQQVQKNPNARNPAALFLWTIKNCKVELKEVELK